MSKELYTVEEGWIETYSGLKFHFAAPSPDEVAIEDIAHALSLLSRYNGHTTRFYSVAEHSILMTWHARAMGITDPFHLLTVLLHDGAEAYIGDMPRPVKMQMQAFKDVEQTIDVAIATKFCLFYPFPDYVKEFDRRILRDEREQAMSTSNNKWGTDELEPLGVKLHFWSPDDAEEKFLEEFFRLTRDYGHVA